MPSDNIFCNCQCHCHCPVNELCWCHQWLHAHHGDEDAVSTDTVFSVGSGEWIGIVFNSALVGEG